MTVFFTGNYTANDKTRKLTHIRLIVANWREWQTLNYPVVRSDSNVIVKELVLDGIQIEFFGERPIEGRWSSIQQTR